MGAAASVGIPVMVLDRPNPLGGLLVEGPILNISCCASRYGRVAVPHRHGMTVGELAGLFSTHIQQRNHERWWQATQHCPNNYIDGNSESRDGEIKVDVKGNPFDRNESTNGGSGTVKTRNKDNDEIIIKNSKHALNDAEINLLGDGESVWRRPSVAGWGGWAHGANGSAVAMLQQPLTRKATQMTGTAEKCQRTEFKMKQDLTVIKLEKWRRALGWEGTGLPFVPPSPNIPSHQTALRYSASVFVEVRKKCEYVPTIDDDKHPSESL